MKKKVYLFFSNYFNLFFTKVNECPETKECIECDTSNIDKDIFCQDFCSQQANLLVQKISKGV
jgi:hypothetical protein